MEIKIKTENLNLNHEKYTRMKYDLEEIIESEAPEKIKENAKKKNKIINEKEIIVMGYPKMHYRVEFYFKNEEEGKKIYLGSIDYSSPVNIFPY